MINLNFTPKRKTVIICYRVSERADSTGATGDRLKEGSAINQSLSSLGNVIKGTQISNLSSSNFQTT